MKEKGRTATVNGAGVDPAPLTVAKGLGTTAAPADNPLHLVLMVYNSAIIACARREFSRLIQALNILADALDFEKDAELAGKLLALYQYCAEFARQECYEEASKILRELHATWTKCSTPLEQEFKEIRRYLEKIMASSSDGIIVTNINGRVELTNEAMRKMLDYTAEEMLGQTVERFNPYLSPRAVREMIEKGINAPIIEELLKRHTVKYVETVLTAKEGHKVPVEMSMSLIEDEAGRPVGVGGVHRDLTRQKHLQQQLMQAEKLSALGEVISGVAHELNNPLTGVMGYAQLLLDTDCSEEVKRDLEMINREAMRCQRIVQNLLAFARRHPPEKRPTDINDLIVRTLELRAYQLQVDNIQVVREFEEDLPPLMADPHQLQQVFLNVINNAHEAMHTFRGEGVLHIVTERMPMGVRIKLIDDGPGIAPEHLKRVFHPFFTTKEVGKGTGLGLSVSYGIVKEHAGNIFAESEPGRGATFVIELPVVEAGRAEAKEWGTPNKGGETSSPHCNGARILAIDDEEVVLKLLTDVLRREGYQVETVREATAGLERIGGGNYDLVICDLKMPGMDGPEFYEELRKAQPALTPRVLFITGDTLGQASQEFLAQVDGRYISKPFRLSILSEKVKEVLRGGDDSNS